MASSFAATLSTEELEGRKARRVVPHSARRKIRDSKIWSSIASESCDDVGGRIRDIRMNKINAQRLMFLI